MKKLLAALGLGATLAFGAPQMAEAQPVVTGGVVNVTIVDVLTGDILSNNNVSVAAALGVAANVCGIAVNVLSVDLSQDGRVDCQSATQQVILTQQKMRKK
jgi:hypothetical protein